MFYKTTFIWIYAYLITYLLSYCPYYVQSKICSKYMKHWKSYMDFYTDYGHTKAKCLILCDPNSSPIPNKYLGCRYKGLVFCRNNGWIMKKMDKGLLLAKLVLRVWPKIPQMPQNLSAQFVCPRPKVLAFNEKRFHWASVVRVIKYYWSSKKFIQSNNLW